MDVVLRVLLLLLLFLLVAHLPPVLILQQVLRLLVALLLLVVLVLVVLVLIGVAVVWVEFDWGQEINRARQTVTEKLTLVSSSLPPSRKPFEPSAALRLFMTMPARMV